MHKDLLIFFVYPGPRGSEEPGLTPPCTGSSFTPAPEERRTDASASGELGKAKINLLPLGLG
jgi:hypothetical protein